MTFVLWHALRRPIWAVVTIFCVSTASPAAPVIKPTENASAALLEEIATLTVRANMLHREGKLGEAIRTFENALAKSVTAFGVDSPRVADFQWILASLYQGKGDYAIALKLYESSLVIRGKVFGPSHPDVASSLNGLASLFGERGDYSTALKLYERGLSIMEGAFGPEHERVAYTLKDLAFVYQDQGDCLKAQALYQRSLRILETKFGPDAPALAGTLNDLAESYREERSFSKALPLFERSLAISKKAFGVQHPEVATILNNLALLRLKQGNDADALKLFHESLEIRQRTLGEDHPDTAASLGNLGRLYRELGDVPQALSMHRRSLTIMETVFRGDHSYVAQSLMDLGVTTSYAGKDDEAVALFHRALAMRERVFGPIHPHVADSLYTLGVVLDRTGKHAEVVPLLERSLDIREKCFGKEHARIAETLNGLAMAYHSQRDFGRAGVLYRRSLDIAERTLGISSPVAMAILKNLAVLAVDTGETQQGVLLFDEWFRRWRTRQAGELSNLPEKYAFLSAVHDLDNLDGTSKLHSVDAKARGSIPACANQLVLGKALFEEVQATQAALETDPRTTTCELREQHQEMQLQLVRLLESKLPQTEREAKRLELQAELARTESHLAERVGLVAQTIRERNLTLTDIARSLPPRSALVDVIEYARFAFAAKTNRWKEQRYAAYLTFPLAKDSTNVIVERVDLGEAAPINEAVEIICKRMSAGQFATKDLAAALQRVSELVYGPLARHLTNVSHLIVCPDGQLSRLPFEMLRVGDKFLIEEKTISYVTSGREIARLGSPLTRPAATLSPSDGARAGNGGAGKSLVMGNPDFDLDLRSSGREEAHSSNPELGTRNSEQNQSLLTSAATRSLSRSFTGLRFTPLPGSGVEATNVARLLGGEAVLRLGADARESELKAVKSPRVLHLATHGFFLSDQEFKQTNARPFAWSPAFTRFGPPEAGTPSNWENPMVRCGLALAGANHFTNSTSPTGRAGSPLPAARSTASDGAHGVTRPTMEIEDGLLTGLEASLLNLQGTELVILSACDSGSGEVKIGEGVMSLRRAFRIAGAETVLASHWKVSDEATSRLMTEFMRRWRGGEPRAQAWREAQLALLRSQDFSNPYFWAAFTLTGQWR